MVYWANAATGKAIANAAQNAILQGVHRLGIMGLLVKSIGISSSLVK
jgi:hypothetical protein